MDSRPRLNHRDYTVGWLCAIAESELIAARRMLDHRHKPPANPNQYDENVYEFGDINEHNLVIACMPPGQPGPVSAQKLIHPLKQSFPNLSIHLFVGIGGGIPRAPSPKDPDEDIHLGDVIVGWADRTGVPAIIQPEFERTQDDQTSTYLGLFNKPSRQLLNALNPILGDRETKETRFHEHLQRLAGLDKFSHPGLVKDVLFDAEYPHTGVGPSEHVCTGCDREHVVKRLKRMTTIPQFHQGTILSGSAIMQSARKRDELSKKYYDAVCIEMEAAGVIDDTHCLVIRGISDYADSHRPGMWRQYAAATAASFAREILCIIQPAFVRNIKPEYDDPNDKILAIIEHGERFARPRQDHIAEDLTTARQYLLQAESSLGDRTITDPNIRLKVYFRLMTVECDLTNDAELCLQDKDQHLKRAEEYGRYAMSCANASRRGDAPAQVKVEQSFVKGRKAEIEDERGTDTREVRRIKNLAISDMDEAMEELQRLNPDKFREYELRASEWRKRLN